MAHPARPPLLRSALSIPRIQKRPRPAHPAHFRCLHHPQSRTLPSTHGRPFSQSAQRNAASFAKAEGYERGPPRPSMKVQMKNLEKAAAQGGSKSEVPNDLGLFPDTFIMPTGVNKPSILVEPRERAVVEWTRIVRKARDLIHLIYYKFFLKGFRSKPRPKIAPFKTRKVALDLHKQMYKSFAAGDLATLDKICAEGVLGTMRTRIGRRAKNETVAWTLHKYIGVPYIVSYRAVMLPFGQHGTKDKATGLQQVVVRIKSRQSLVRGTKSLAASKSPVGAPAGGKNDKGKSVGTAKVEGRGKLPGEADGEEFKATKLPEQKDVTEYFVIQKRLWMGEEGPWMVWGMTEESSVEELMR